MFGFILQLAAGLFIIWGLFHEERLVRLERKIGAALRRRFGQDKKRRPAAPVRRPVRTVHPMQKTAVRVRTARTSRCA